MKLNLIKRERVRLKIYELRPRSPLSFYPRLQSSVLKRKRATRARAGSGTYPLIAVWQKGLSWVPMAQGLSAAPAGLPGAGPGPCRHPAASTRAHQATRPPLHPVPHTMTRSLPRALRPAAHRSTHGWALFGLTSGSGSLEFCDAVWVGSTPLYAVRPASLRRDQ